MKYHRREFLKFGLVSLIGISFINTKAISFFNNIKMQKIGNNSYFKK
jgi:hypothetical protein